MKTARLRACPTPGRAIWRATPLPQSTTYASSPTRTSCAGAERRRLGEGPPPVPSSTSRGVSRASVDPPSPGKAEGRGEGKAMRPATARTNSRRPIRIPLAVYHAPPRRRKRSAVRYFVVDLERAHHPREDRRHRGVLSAGRDEERVDDVAVRQ